MKTARKVVQADLLGGLDAAAAVGTMAMRAEVHDAMTYPHRVGCERCYAARRCSSCGVGIQHDPNRCTNGHCGACHRDHCAPETTPRGPHQVRPR